MLFLIQEIHLLKVQRTFSELFLKNNVNHLYINVPFCKTLCHFCNFYKNPLKKIDDFFSEKSLSFYYLKELELRGEIFPKKRLASIYLGGGSPLELPPRHLMELLEYFSAFEVEEYTVESNPDFTIYQEYYAFFNRISVGIQSFDASLLNMLGRNYDVSIKFLESLPKYFHNISADLVYDIPGQTLNQALNDVERLLSFNPKHISYYLLEENNLLRKKRLTLKKEDNNDALKVIHSSLREKLFKSGYQAYELSNYSLPNYASIHNQAYWMEKDYLGIGPGACGRITDSSANIKRYQNHRNLKHYIESISSGHLPIEFEENLSKTDLMNEYLLTHIRLPKGIELRDFNERFQKDLLKDQLLILKKYSCFLQTDSDFIALNENGILYSNEIASELFYDEE